MILLRSTLFNLCFYMITGCACVLLLPTLLLPRRFYMAVVYGFVHTTAFLEKYILGLRYEIRGTENLPKEGSYIIAAKHQSAYETFKLHILFNDPAVVLKRELLKIPFWGKYLGKSDPIAIDRSSPKTAIKSLKEEGERVAAQKRPIVIFPQGTRVSINTSAQEKPYKIGLFRLQEETKLPIIPLAMNSGYFYPKHKWCKKSGAVIFEFLPGIPYQESQNTSTSLKNLEMLVEEKSAHLLEEAQNARNKAPIFANILSLCVISFAIYTTYWFFAANLVKKHLQQHIYNIQNHHMVTDFDMPPARIYGYPFKINVEMQNQTISSRYESLSIQKIHTSGLPLLNSPIAITLNNVALSTRQWNGPVEIDSINANLKFYKNGVEIYNSHSELYNSKIDISGSIITDKVTPDIDLNMSLRSIEKLVTQLQEIKAIDGRKAQIALVGLKAVERDGVIKTNIKSHENSLYLHDMIKIFSFPAAPAQ